MVKTSSLSNRQGRITYPTRYKILNGDTINFYDRYKQRQGLFIYNTKKYREKIIYKDNECYNGESVTFGKSGKVINLYKNGLGISRGFHLNGQLKKECKGFEQEDNMETPPILDRAVCNEWDSLGNIISNDLALKDCGLLKDPTIYSTSILLVRKLIGETKTAIFINGKYCSDIENLFQFRNLSNR